jgi:hypothetical protein
MVTLVGDDAQLRPIEPSDLIRQFHDARPAAGLGDNPHQRTGDGRDRAGFLRDGAVERRGTGRAVDSLHGYSWA